jgi:hypothetical protein
MLQYGLIDYGPLATFAFVGCRVSIFEPSEVMNRREQYIVGVGMIIPLWLIASFILWMACVDAEDPGLPIGEIVTHTDAGEFVSPDPNYKGEHQGEFPPVPLWLKAANLIAIPVDYLLPHDGFKALPEHANCDLFFLGMFASSVLWGFLIVFIFRVVARSFGVTRKGVL